ncbi:hypothetical protein EAE96_011204 [Botrytis aclada]|nr:hypothetical protein EAE96_011204 [Botrytis aclada]
MPLYGALDPSLTKQLTIGYPSLSIGDSFESSASHESKNTGISSRICTRQTHRGDEENVLKSTDRKCARYYNLDILASGTTQNTGTFTTTVTGFPNTTAADA